MAGITLAQAEAKLTLWLAADDAVARNQGYKMPGGRELTRADAREIRENVTYWNGFVEKLTPGADGIAVYAGRPIDR